MRSGLKHIQKTDFKYVNIVEQDGRRFYFARLIKPNCTKSFDDLREAAKWIDRKLIERGKKPVNILKKT